MNHPTESEWMEFLYEEITPSRKRDLRQHLRECPACAEQVVAWKAGMRSLDAFRLPAAKAAPVALWQPVLRWGAAAAVILALGFVLGRTTSVSSRQLRELQVTVANLNQAAQSSPALAKDNVAAIANQVASQETLRILNEYTRALEDQRTQDRRSTALAIYNLESRIAGLHTDLETVAVNTQDGLQETHAGLAQLALLSRNSARPAKTIFAPGN